MNTKPILAYDCATIGANIALRVKNQTYSHQIRQTQQAAELIPAIDALLKEAGVTYAELGAIVTTTGPGSFTGVRIGLAALHGLVQATATPIKLLTTLEAVACQHSEAQHGPFTITLRAGKGEVYAQDFETRDGRTTTISDIRLESETKIDWALPTLSTALPDASAMLNAAEHLPTASLAEAIPVYIRPPDAALPAAYPWLSKN